MESDELIEAPARQVVCGFEVFLNGSRLCTAGVGLVGSLNTIVDVVGAKTDHQITIRVGGLENNEFRTWVWRKLQIGDEVTVRIVDSPSIDDPISRLPDDF